MSPTVRIIRIQVFDGSGRYTGQWNNMHRPCGLCISPEPDFLFYVGELGPSMPFNRDHPHLGPRISILTHKGELLARLGDGGLGHQPDQFIAPHGMAVDGRGDVYRGGGLQHDVAPCLSGAAAAEGAARAAEPRRSR